MTEPEKNRRSRDENAGHLLPPGDLAEEIEILRNQVLDERERYLRLLADFTNYRRRGERDKAKLESAARRELVLPFLDIVDDLEKALRWADMQKQPGMDGIRQIHKKLTALLETHDVRPFVSVGMPFDHHIHDAIAVEQPGSHGPGMVIDELRRGYFLGDELLRPAQVRVSSSE
jgi:molecular chaperone GrpE